jgi:hypothetical protein
MEGQIFIDGDFKSNKGKCKYHCYPTCHPGQIDPNKREYGCLNPIWPANRAKDFCPLVDCMGDRRKCETKRYIKYIKKEYKIIKELENE